MYTTNHGNQLYIIFTWFAPHIETFINNHMDGSHFMLHQSSIYVYLYVLQQGWELISTFMLWLYVI